MANQIVVGLPIKASEVATVVNALRVAASQYVEDARVCERDGNERLAQQFHNQANEAASLADYLDEQEFKELRIREIE